MQGEDGDASCDERYNEVFVQGVALAEDSEMQEHNREEFAGFGKDKGNIIDVRQRGVSERGSERGGDGNKDEGGSMDRDGNTAGVEVEDEDEKKRYA